MKIKLNDNTLTMDYNGATITFTEKQYKIIKYLVNNNYELKYEEFNKEHLYTTMNAFSLTISRINKRLDNILYIKRITKSRYKLLVSPSKNE